MSLLWEQVKGSKVRAGPGKCVAGDPDIWHYVYMKAIVLCRAL